MNNRLDLLLVNAPARLGVYGKLTKFAAIEPPVWAGLIAQHCLNKGFTVQILDAEAEGLITKETAQRIVDLNPRLAAFCVYGQQPSASTQCLPAASDTVEWLKLYNRDIATLALGTHPSALPERTLREEPFDYVCQGEGPSTITALLQGLQQSKEAGKLPSDFKWPLGLCYLSNGSFGYSRFGRAPNITSLDEELPDQAWHLLDMKRYRAHNWHLWTGNPKGGYASVQTSLGCPFKCLRGDTLVNTIYGDIPIEVLARSGIKSVPVYTYKDGEVVVADAVQIMKLGVDEKLVRVAFDDGTHIDVTPDHKFLKFRINRPKNGEVEETAVEAQDLKPRDRIRAVAIRFGVRGRKRVEYGRKGKYNAVLIKEYQLKRKLKEGERVHHDDRDPSNDDPKNLVLCDSWLDHIRNHHPEVSQRMRANNPMRNKKTARKVGRTLRKKYKITPFARSPKGTKNISAAAQHRMLTNNPMKNPSIAMNPKLRRSRSKRMKAIWADKQKALAFLGRSEVNHKVISVTPLQERDDVYCLEVPGYGWFFANNVLVKNCSFCCINTPFGGSGIRYWSPANGAAQIANLVERHGITNFKIPDEMFVLNRSHVWQLCNMLIDMGLGNRLNIWAYARVDTVKDTQLLDKMRAAGFRWLALGIESGSKHVRDGVEKGRFGNEDILAAVRRVQAAGICVGANYIFGLPDDTVESMQQTLDLACEINAEYANFYPTMAYPGSPLHSTAKAKGWRLPEDEGGPGWLGYSMHAPETLPLPTETLRAGEVLAFRDEAFIRYFSRPEYISMMQRKFGDVVVEEIKEMIALGMPWRLYLGA